MRLLVRVASIGVVAVGLAASAQEGKKESPKAEITKATFLAKGMH